MPKISGTLFAHNVLRFDYCAKESIQGLLGFCDEVVVLDCESTDGTLEMLNQMAAENSKLVVIPGVKWERGHKHERLAIQANDAIDRITSEWNFMGQCDEVVHEDSYQAIRDAITNPRWDAFACRRYNLFGDFNHMISLTSQKKPCSDVVIRIGKKHVRAMGDAESLHQANLSGEYTDRIKIFHYGLVRKPEALIAKSIDMQSWFHHPGHVDKRILKMRDENYFDPYELIAKEEIVPVPYHHPAIMKDWIQARSVLVEQEERGR